MPDKNCPPVLPPPRPRRPFWAWRQKFRDYSDLVRTSGYIPKTNRFLQVFFKWVCLLVGFVQIGRRTIKGKENLKSPGRLVYVFNHGAWMDGALMYPLLPLGTRYLSAYEEMPDLRGILMAKCGSVAVDRSHGCTAVEPAIQLLTAGSPVGLAPEGKISKTAEYLRFKTGAARIALETWERLGRKELVGIVPIQICYHRRFPNGTGSPLRMGLKWRRGVTITVGKPIYMHEQESLDHHDITRKIKMCVMCTPCATIPGEKEAQ